MFSYSCTSHELRNSGAKCRFRRAQFGILFAVHGVTGGSPKFSEPNAAQLVRQQFRLEGVTILVLTMQEMRHSCRELRGVADPLAEDLRDLAFGPKAKR